ncbi:hypothetical protein Syun_029247 [Stephania yunnanensis]|uniref:Uncharacterized protein n=1 Tax=Stephania yunnanensis TaxID=152371 RepID=A0AAP0E894_9MAGN
MKELGIRLRGGFEDDQEGVRTMDDDNFIDDILEWIREVARGEVDNFARAILGQAYAAITNSEEILLAAIQTESRHGNKKESDILMARQKTLFVGCKRFTNLSKLTLQKAADKYKDSVRCEN